MNKQHQFPVGDTDLLFGVPFESRKYVRSTFATRLILQGVSCSSGHGTDRAQDIEQFRIIYQAQRVAD